MIEIKNKRDCCGCNACGDICPKDSISFEADEEGFWYPVVNMDTCIDCHLCEKVCPIITKADFIERYSKSNAYIRQLCQSSHVFFRDMSQDKHFMKPEYFMDDAHLNKKGAELYTKKVISIIRENERKM